MVWECNNKFFLTRQGKNLVLGVLCYFKRLWLWLAFGFLKAENAEFAACSRAAARLHPPTSPAATSGNGRGTVSIFSNMALAYGTVAEAQFYF